MNGSDRPNTLDLGKFRARTTCGRTRTAQRRQYARTSNCRAHLDGDQRAVLHNRQRAAGRSASCGTDQVKLSQTGTAFTHQLARGPLPATAGAVALLRLLLLLHIAGRECELAQRGAGVAIAPHPAPLQLHCPSIGRHGLPRGFCGAAVTILPTRGEPVPGAMSTHCGNRRPQMGHATSPSMVRADRCYALVRSKCANGLPAACELQMQQRHFAKRETRTQLRHRAPIGGRTASQSPAIREHMPGQFSQLRTVCWPAP